MLQCARVRRCVLRYPRLNWRSSMGRSIPQNTVCCRVLQYAAECCSMLQCVAVCCSVLQYAAVCCSMLQCVAVCCSVLQCVVVPEANLEDPNGSTNL